MNGIQMEKMEKNYVRAGVHLDFCFSDRSWDNEGFCLIYSEALSQNRKTEGGSISGKKKTRMVTENLETQNVSCFFDTKITKRKYLNRVIFI